MLVDKTLAGEGGEVSPFQLRIVNHPGKVIQRLSYSKLTFTFKGRKCCLPRVQRWTIEEAE